MSFSTGSNAPHESGHALEVTAVSYVVPFHSDVDRLSRTIEVLRANRTIRRIGEVLLCHNGRALPMSSLDSLRGRLDPGFEKLLHTEDAGIGAGYRMGISNAACTHLVLSASDLPFGFSDLDAFVLEQRRTSQPIPLAIGSKGHCDSRVGPRPLARRVASLVFFGLRRAMLGPLTPRDSQGTFLGLREVLVSLAEECPANGYLFSLELATACTHRYRRRILELPIRQTQDDGPSSVSLIGEAPALLGSLLRIRKRRLAQRSRSKPPSVA